VASARGDDDEVYKDPRSSKPECDVSKTSVKSRVEVGVVLLDRFSSSIRAGEMDKQGRGGARGPVATA